MTGLRFPAPRRPDVSIVIPAFGAWEWLVRALGAILANTEPCYELIVIDNASPEDISGRLASTTENVRIVRNAKNYGFGLACNQGAALACGELLVFLNADALVHAGWLPPLMDTATKSPLVGAVGPRFLNLDDTIQEAGALLFADTTTIPYGNHSPDERGEFTRPRIVDYVSAACLLIRRRVFNEVGGFDPAYAPAYYEDIDLCLALAARGYLTAYEPRSAVTHVNGWSGEHGVGEAVLERNRELFARRWSSVLAARPELGSGELQRVIAARDAPLHDRLLIVSERMPEKESRGRELLRALASLCPAGHVALLTPNLSSGESQLCDDLRGIEIASASDGLESAHDWLAGRRFHYDVILSLAPRPVSLEQAAAELQPQASWILDLWNESPAAIERGGAAEISATDAILVASDDAVRAVAAKLPNVPAFCVEGDGMRGQVLEVLLHFGFASGFDAHDQRRAG